MLRYLFLQSGFSASGLPEHDEGVGTCAASIYGFHGDEAGTLHTYHGVAVVLQG